MSEYHVTVDLVMTVHKLTAGDGYTYLTRQVAAHDATTRGYDRLGDYYSEKGEAPGIWMGRGLSGVPDSPLGGYVTEPQMTALFGEGRHPNADQIEAAARAAGATEAEIDQASRLGAPFRIYDAANEFHRRCAGGYRDFNLVRDLAPDTAVPVEERARIRTDLARAMFVETYGRDLVDERELTGHLARISRQATTAVAGYDLTFSPVKSVSTLWAIAPRDVAQVIEQAHQDAVVDTLSWLEDNAAYTRRGRNGIAQVDVRGLIAAAFTHRDSRAGDPDLHTHVAISNKVQTLDGRWLALDGRMLYRHNVSASEHYNTRLEGYLTDRVGVDFAERGGDDPRKRPVREVVGIDGELPRRWSSRRSAIVARHQELALDFQAAHGRPPSATEAIALAERANLETRQGKHEPRSAAEQRAAWGAEAIEVLGGAKQLDAYVRGALGRPRARRRPTRRWVTDTAVQVLETISGTRAVWQEHHIRAEAERRARAARIGTAHLDDAVTAVVTRCLGPGLSVPLEPEPAPSAPAEPAALRRRDGSSVYVVAGSRLYTSARILAAEQAILDAAARQDGRQVEPDTVDLALLESTANGVELNPGQVALVRELATSGRRVQLALAPAGTGKTTAMRVLARCWTASGGEVVGLAPYAAAAAVLGEELGAGAETVAKLIDALRVDRPAPAWVARIGPDTLVVIDEAGTAATPDLARVIEFVLERGGSVRLIGDDQQLAAIGAGGILRDLAHAHGALTLSQVMRFTHPDGTPNHAEGAASLALRDGDPAAIAHYTDQHRVHVGDLITAADQTYTAWAADRDAGRDAIMLAPTRDLVADLNQRARAARLAGQPDGADGPEQAGGTEVTLAGGMCACAGDTILTTRNERRLRLGPTDYVRNGYRWTVTRVRDDGGLDATHRRTRQRITLPADYVADHVALGYAATIHKAQGITADTTHALAIGAEDRQTLYVAMTRGRYANHLYLATVGDGDPHTVITRDALLPPSPVDLLTRILDRDGSAISATSHARDLTDPFQQLPATADQYYDAVATAAETRLGPDRMAGVARAAATVWPGLTDEPAWPTLRAHLAIRLLTGARVEDLRADAVESVVAADLRTAIESRELDTALDVAAVLDWRLDDSGSHSAPAGPLAWLPGVPDVLAGDPEWGPYLVHRRDELRQTAAAVSRVALAWTPTSAPAWAAPLLDTDPQLVAALAVWRAAHQVPDTDLRPTGPALPDASQARIQRRLEDRVTRILGNPRTVTGSWAALATSIDPQILTDPYWPVLARRFGTAERSGIDIAALARTVATTSPLPDEQPAAALWWRLSGHLTAAATLATDLTAPDTLRPDWVPALAEMVGAEPAQRVMADPAWPALVAAVTHARRAGWAPEHLLGTAYDLLAGAQPDDEPLRPTELTTALLWRVGMLTDPHPITTTSTAPAPAVDDLDRLPTTILDAAHDWLDGLTEPDDPEQLPPDVSTHPRPQIPSRRSTLALPPTSDQDGDVLWDAVTIRRERLLELNQHASEFFALHYPDSWAPAYLRERLGTDLSDEPRFTVGHAPAGWTTLTDHLRAAGATDEEILAAGLGTRATTGRIIDRFRDRLVFPILDGQHIIGFIGRRNPTTADTDRAGPKYLNTAETAVFVKGHALYGLSENAKALSAGAVPVLVEGPLDAIAITLAGQGRYIGIAPLGTALTDTQADKLVKLRALTIIVATDPDLAGQHAAHRAFWLLAARGISPGHLLGPDDQDPADLLRTRGPAGLGAALDHATTLAAALIERRIAAFDARLDTSEGRLQATRAAAQIIGALPPRAWTTHLVHLVRTLDVLPEAALNAVSTAQDEWTADPHGTAQRRLSQRIPDPPPQVRDRPARSAAAPTRPDRPQGAGHRWAALADAVHPALTDDPGWAALAAALDRAAHAGYDVEAALPALATDPPLPADHTARALLYRLVQDIPAAMPAPSRPRPPDPAPAGPNDPTTARQPTDTYRRPASETARVTDQPAAPAQVDPPAPGRARPPAPPVPRSVRRR